MQTHKHGRPLRLRHSFQQACRFLDASGGHACTRPWMRDETLTASFCLLEDEEGAPYIEVAMPRGGPARIYECCWGRATPDAERGAYIDPSSWCEDLDAEIRTSPKALSRARLWKLATTPAGLAACLLLCVLALWGLLNLLGFLMPFLAMALAAVGAFCALVLALGLLLDFKDVLFGGGKARARVFKEWDAGWEKRRRRWFGSGG